MYNLVWQVHENFGRHGGDLIAQQSIRVGVETHQAHLKNHGTMHFWFYSPSDVMSLFLSPKSGRG